jgi:hypothetical protein
VVNALCICLLSLGVLLQVHVFKKKARKRYSKLQGHRSHITALRILEVRQPTAEAAVSNIQAISPGQEAAPQAAVGISAQQLTPQQLKQGRSKLAAKAATGPKHGTAAAPSAACAAKQQQQHAGATEDQEAGAGQQQHAGATEGQEAAAGQQQQHAGATEGQEAGAGQQQQHAGATEGQQAGAGRQQQTVDRHEGRQHGPPAVMNAFPRPLRSTSAQQESP